MVEPTLVDYVGLILACLWFTIGVGTVLFTLWFTMRIVGDREQTKGEKE